MLNVSTGGAAFLTATDHAPPLGTLIQLKEMFSRDQTVREVNPPLPPFARVLRVEHDDYGTTRRVAIRFEADVPDALPSLQRGQFVASCSGLRVPLVPPALMMEPATQKNVPAGCC